MYKAYIIVFAWLTVAFLGGSPLTMAQGQKCLAVLASDIPPVLHSTPSNSIKIRQTVFLPIVVHILYSDDAQNISDEQIKAQIERLNEDFSKSNENFSNTPLLFQEVAADTEIQFCLASSDPDSNPTNGITRTETSFPEIGLSDAYFRTNLGGKTGWDNQRYINIWVADMGDSEILGFATFPGEANPVAKDGILINFRYFGNGGDHMETPHQLGRALTHEMGHYLGVFHTWGELGGGCNSDDQCSDTPLQEGPTFGCPTFPNPDMCTQNNGIMFMNFMDYTDDDCLSMFTEDQKDRMWNSLQGSRSILLDQSLTACTVSDREIQYEEWNIYPNPANSVVTLTSSKSRKRELVRMYDSLGREILTTEVMGAAGEISIDHLERGMYYVSFRGNVRKLLVVR